MPRPAVPPEKRRRVARACDSCKRRKERCNGVHPCSICTRRKKQHECYFSDTPAKLLRPSNGLASTPPKPGDRYENDSTAGSVGAGRSDDGKKSSGNGSSVRGDSGIAINRLLNEPTTNQGSLGPSLAVQAQRSLSAETGGEVPGYARLLRDPDGKYMYIGDSASLSFLQSVRRIAALAVGDCDFTTDPKRHSILETAPSCPMVPSNSHLPLVYSEVVYLAKQYLLATAGLLDMFDLSTFWPDLESWVNDPRRDMDQRSCVFYLVMAIGAQVSTSNCQQQVPEQYFSRGRQMAFYNFTEAPSLMTVQAYTLITIYMLGACRRNGAFMNFGIAIRATFALGMQIPSTHNLFDAKESHDRRVTWRSVRMLDVFFAASLGRPPATAETMLPVEIEALGADGISTFSEKVLALSAIYDRIVIEVYIKKAVSTRLAESISRQLEVWTQNLPSSLELQSFPAYDEERLAEILAASHVLSSYYWAIILLTRPFLTSQILQDMSRKKSGKSTPAVNSAEDASIKAFADACVDASFRGLDVVASLLNYRTLPKRLPLLINAVCNIALVLGSAVFADQDRNPDIIEGLEQALKVLRHFAPHDPHASRYEQIITYLYDAANLYIRRREIKLQAQHRLLVEPRHDEASRRPLELLDHDNRNAAAATMSSMSTSTAVNAAPLSQTAAHPTPLSGQPTPATSEGSTSIATITEPTYDQPMTPSATPATTAAAGGFGIANQSASSTYAAATAGAQQPLSSLHIQQQQQNDSNTSSMSDLLAYANGVVAGATSFPDTFQPPSSIFDDAQISFPDDAYLFMEQEPSIFGFWNGL
ncbi:hypothetical protein AAFC00_002442 [Neodothiora populina]|uniref:Zn(2)-C6 fungal-type domain-containing protein n=1 Tax=Neodothiora populina TaxID=2781224 RepID=A0ABR3P7V4_9PEZI